MKLADLSNKFGHMSEFGFKKKTCTASKCLISNFSIFAKTNRVSVAGGFLHPPAMGSGDERTGFGGFVRLS